LKQITLELFVFACLKVDVALDANIGSVNVGAVNGHVHVGGPGRVAPFDIQAIVGLEGRRQGAIGRKTTLPLNRKVSVAVDGRGNAVIVINLLGDGDFLASGRSGELDVGLIVVVVNDNVFVFVLEIETRSDGDTGTILVESLGGLHGAQSELLASTGYHVDAEVSFFVIGVKLNVGVGEILSVNFGTSRDSPAGDVRAGLAPDAARKARKVGRWAC
jgi:hypothetical protein